jgi:hypothetical protein
MRRLLYAPFTIALVLAFIPTASAEMWCADPLWVHEWGVQVFGADGRTRAQVAMPSYFHRRGPTGAPSGEPVREMPADGGERELPVVHFYTRGAWDDGVIPVALAVGFTRGDATAWFPQVDVRRPAAQANGPSGVEGRRRVLAARQALTPFGARAPIEADPSRQLEWARLALTREPQHTAPPTDNTWVRDLRGLPALWVNNTRESERFVFYEGATNERAAITIARGDQHRAGRRHYVLTNTNVYAVHDVFVVHREGDRVFVFFAPQIPARRTAGFVIEEHHAANVAAATRDRLRQGLIDAAQPAPPDSYSWGAGNCVMGRDPALPVEAAEGHALYAHEVDAILRVWGPRFFDAQGTTILYREDPRYLDEVMPLSVYTDMYHFPLIRRAGLALWENVALP